MLLWVWTRLGVAGIESRHPPLGRMIEVNGQALHILDEGQGPALILLHGANSNLRDFASSLLPRLKDDFRVIAIDRPGYGHSPRAPGDWQDPAALARLVLDAAEQLGAQRPILLGHSWAGSVVMAAAVHEPERLGGGILLAGATGHWNGGVGWTYELGATPLLGRAFAELLLYPAGQFQLEAALAGVVAPHEPPPDYAQRIGAALALRPDTFRHNVEDMNRLSPYLQELSRHYRHIRTPLLVIHAKDDELVPFWNHGERLLPQIPGLQLGLLDAAGHAPHHIVPDEVSRLIVDFAGELRTAQAGR